jgi:hypothetical protein
MNHYWQLPLLGRIISLENHWNRSDLFDVYSLNELMLPCLLVGQVASLPGTSKVRL